MSSHFESEQWVAAPLSLVFAFFSDPHNLPRIMPPGLGTKLVKLNLVPPRPTPAPFAKTSQALSLQSMAGVGTEMTVAFRVIPYVPIHERWVVRVTEFSLNQYFHDVQKQGPFRRWEHTHSFEASMQSGREGTLIHDEVDFEVGFGVVGTTLEKLLFRRMFLSTFEYRRQALERLFASASQATSNS